jgi:hypothetical protein
VRLTPWNHLAALRLEYGNSSGVGAVVIWLVVWISINGAPPQVVEKIPYDDMQSCQAEKAARDHRQDIFTARGVSVVRSVICSDGTAGPIG